MEVKSGRSRSAGMAGRTWLAATSTYSAGTAVGATSLVAVSIPHSPVGDRCSPMAYCWAPGVAIAVVADVVAAVVLEVVLRPMVGWD